MAVNIYAVVAAGIRLLAIFLAWLALKQLGSAWLIQRANGDLFQFPWISFGIIMLPAVAAVVLWLFPYTLAKKLAPGLDRGSSEGKINHTIIFRIGVVLLGIWIFYQSIGDVIYLIVIWQASSEVMLIQDDFTIKLIISLLELAFSVCLMFGSGGLAKFFSWLRNFDAGGQ